MAGTSAFNHVNVSAVDGLRDTECEFWDRVQNMVVNPVPDRVKGSQPNRFKHQHTMAAGQRGPDRPDASLLGLGGWKPIDAVMPTARAQFVAVTVDTTEIFLVGGLVPTAGAEFWRDTGSVDVFDPHTLRWRPGPVLATVRSGHAGGVIDGVIYVVGGKAIGQEGRLAIHASMESLDTAELHPSWRVRRSLPQPRTEIAAAVMHGRLYVLGGTGVDSRTDFDSVWSFCPGSDQWKLEPALQTARSGLAAASYADRLFAFGGFRGGSQVAYYDTDPLDSVEVLHAKSSGVALRMRAPRHGAASLSVPGVGVVLVGGHMQRDLKTVELLLPNRTWAELPNLPARRSMLGAAEVGGCIYAFGGLRDDTTSTAISAHVECLCL
eukprot:TRINITY_DN5713_c0_g1_i6.p1 TRINITY_DN5713_c0_g1~~TRINITY_DN5713_c0_g1_i6.p1  ORF type:complete len:379 (-),score=47.54 TRINITY_DN5713_c0_g1_i6:222-1358(-)